MIGQLGNLGQLGMSGGSRQPLPQQIAQWQGGALVPIQISSRLESETISQYSFPDGPASKTTPFTFIEKRFGVRCNCSVTSLRIKPYYIGSPGGQTWYLAVMTKTDTYQRYTCRALAPFTLTGTGVIDAWQTATLSTPVEVYEGEALGLITPTKCAVGGAQMIGEGRMLPVSVTGAVAVGSEVDYTVYGSSWPSTYLNFAAYTNKRPYVAFLGDSLISGGNHNETTLHDCWRTDQESSWAASGPIDIDMIHPGGNPGNIDNSVMHRIAVRMSSNCIMQNFAFSGSTFASIISDNVTQYGSTLNRLYATDPKIIVIHCGVNDMLSGRNWANIAVNLDAISVKLDGRTVLLCDIMPYSGSNDTQSGLIRSFNESLSAYCDSHPRWHFVATHDSMGVVRASTGFFDDMVPAYVSSDNLHLNSAGVDKLAELIAARIKSV